MVTCSCCPTAMRWTAFIARMRKKVSEKTMENNSNFRVNLKSLTFSELEEFIAGLAVEKYRAKQLATWIFKRRHLISGNDGSFQRFAGTVRNCSLD